MIHLQSRLTEARTDTKDGPTVLVVGDNYVSSTIARRLVTVADATLVTDDRYVATHASGLPVLLVSDCSADELPADLSEGTVLLTGTLPETETLRAAGADDADVAIVAMTSDSCSLLATQLLRTQFETFDVVTVIEDPRNEETFEDVAMETVCLPDLVASTLETTLDEAFSIGQHA